MTVGAFSLATNWTRIAVTRKKPGHFVALTEDGRIDAMLAQGGAKLPPCSRPGPPSTSPTR